MFTSKAVYPRDLLLGTSFALLCVPSRTARTFTPFCRAHDEIPVSMIESNTKLIEINVICQYIVDLKKVLVRYLH